MEDPYIKGLVKHLEQEAGSFCNSFARRDGRESFSNLLEVCRYIQRIRLEIGSLKLLSHGQKARISAAVRMVLEQFITAITGVDSSGSLKMFLRAERKWVRLAVINITDRVREMSMKNISGIRKTDT